MSTLHVPRPIPAPERPHRIPWLGKRGRGRFGLLFLGVSIVLGLLSHPWIARTGAAHVLMMSAAWALFIAGGLMRFWATLYIGGRKSKKVIRQGPYARVRHPLYVGSFLLAISCALFLESMTILAGALLAAAAYGLWSIPMEERKLLRQFGEDYRLYSRSTPRFLPKLGHPAGADRYLEVDMHAMKREFSRALGWLILPPLMAMLGGLRWEAWWPALMNLP